MAPRKKTEAEVVEDDDDLELEEVEKPSKRKTSKTTKSSKSKTSKKSKSKKDDNDDDDEPELEVNSDDAEERKSSRDSRTSRNQPREPRPKVDASRPAQDMSTQDLLRHLADRGEENLNPTLRQGALSLLAELTRARPARRRPRYGSKTGPRRDEQEEETFLARRPRYGSKTPAYGSKTSAPRQNTGPVQRQSTRRNRSEIYDD